MEKRATPICMHKSCNVFMEKMYFVNDVIYIGNRKNGWYDFIIGSFIQPKHSILLSNASAKQGHIYEITLTMGKPSLEVTRKK